MSNQCPICLSGYKLLGEDECASCRAPIKPEEEPKPQADAARDVFELYQSPWWKDMSSKLCVDGWPHVAVVLNCFARDAKSEYDRVARERDEARIIAMNEKLLADKERARSAKLLSALKFECGNRCAEQNPCNAKLAIREYEKEST